MQVYQYVEEHYKDGELTSLAARLHCDLTWLSRAIRRLSGCTYTELVQKAAEPGLLSPAFHRSVRAGYQHGCGV